MRLLSGAVQFLFEKRACPKSYRVLSWASESAGQCGIPCSRDQKLVTAAVAASEEKTSRLLFKIAVELGKISNMLAAANEVDDETLRELHIMCIDEVRKINGIITYDSAAKFQRND